LYLLLDTRLYKPGKVSGVDSKDTGDPSTQLYWEQGDCICY
jgi:hypothetical protein